MAVNELGEEERLERDSFTSYRQSYHLARESSSNTWGTRLERIVNVIPDKLAFVQGDRKLTWKQFDERVNKLANGLFNLGIKKGERVGIAGFNSIEWMESYFAISKIGAVPFNLNPRATLDEIAYIIKDADAVAMIVEDEYARVIERVIAGIASLRYFIVYGTARSPQYVPHGALDYDILMAKYRARKPKLRYRVTNEDFCYLMYTSEKTGYPKGVVWDGEQRVKGVEQLIYNILLPPFDRYGDEKIFEFLFNLYPLPGLRALSRLSRRFGFIRVVVIRFFRMTWGKGLMADISRRLKKEGVKYVPVCPLFHASAYMQTFGMVAAIGATTVFLPTSYPFNARELLETIEREKVDGVMINGDAFALPILDELKKAKEEGRTYDLSSCRSIASSGVRWSPRTKRELCKFLPQVVVMDAYGCTEFSVGYGSIAVLEDKELPCAGATLPARGGVYSLQVPFKVINRETGKEVTPRTGEVGEFVAAGYVSLGYWKRPADTKKAFRVIDGRRCFFTGDDGYIDEKLRFCLIGRGGKECIDTGEEKVYSEEIEEFIKSHPKVRDAAVVGVPDKELGQVLAAVIEGDKEEELSERDVVEYCSQGLPAHKIPKHVMLVVSLPREATGKVEKRVLKEFVESRLGGEA